MNSLPNILWICTDQQRADTLGCCGNSFVHTPNLDRLASEGALFENCFSQSPICTPSRASFLTGRYPRTTRARQNGQDIPADEMLITKLLADNGYTCGLAGKLHLSTCDPRFCPDIERRIDDGYKVFHWSHHPNPDWPKNAYTQWLAENDVSYETPALDDTWQVRKGMPEQYHQTTWCANKTIEFLTKQVRQDSPWLFSFNCFDPHFPFDPPEKYLEPYLEQLDEIPLPVTEEGELENKPRWQQPDFRDDYHYTGPHHPEEMTPRQHRLTRAAYWAMVDLIDAQVGRVLEALDATGQRQDTLVIFTSDHGEMLGDHDLYLKGPYFYDPAVRVPLIVSWPDHMRTGCADTLVELMDLAPTVLEAAGLERPEGMQAKSLWPILENVEQNPTHREDVYCEYYYGMGCEGDPPPYATMLRTETHKLVVAHGLDQGELYDLRQDPDERQNLWDDQDYKELKSALLKRLCDRMAFTVDPLPPRRGHF
ncbi:MAG: sulfatase-like hydrolase/transferase [Planctomycetes bacterium]|nr:sulfatase-like hydrolase/transferase [Planctomycetota bacterium]